MNCFGLGQGRPWEVRGPVVLCQTYSVLLRVLEQPRVDISSAGPIWKQLVELA